MPDLTQDEADRCPYCDQFLHDPPVCCTQMMTEYDAEFIDRERRAKHDYDPAEEWRIDP